MGYVVHSSGTKLGSLVDARMAYSIDVRVRDIYDTRLDAYWRAEDKHLAGKGPKPLPVDISDVLPPQWVRLGEGCYRTVYMSPKGVVYKVNNSREDNESEPAQNYAEMTNILRLKGEAMVPEGWAIPDATLYRMPGMQEDYVIAMPKLDTSMPLSDCYGWGCNEPNGCNNSKANALFDHMCTSSILLVGETILNDIHCSNVFPDSNGTLWIVDCAC